MHNICPVMNSTVTLAAHQFPINFMPCICLTSFSKLKTSIKCSVLCLVAQTYPTLCNPMDCSLPGSSVHGDSPGKDTGVGCHALLQGIFPTQGSNPGLLHCRQILYHLSHQGGPRILEWIAMPSSRGSSQPRDQTQVSCIAGGFFTIWASRELKEYWSG